MTIVLEPDKSALTALRQQLARSAAKNAALENELTKPGGVYGGEPVADVVFGVAQGFTNANRALMLGSGLDGGERYSVSAAQAVMPVVFSTSKGALRVTPVAPDSGVDVNRVGSITLDLALTPQATPASGTSSAYRTIGVPGDDNGWRPEDPHRMLRHEGGGIWRGTIRFGAESYKFAANGDWTVNWGKGGKTNGDNFDRLVQPGLYTVTWDENDPGNPLLVLVGVSAGSCSATFICEKASTSYGQSAYVVGSIPQLGAWDPSKAVPLSPEQFPLWRGTVDGLPANTRFEWKFIIREEGGDKRVIAWERGNNHVSITGAEGEIGPLRGAIS
jgi:hypothetical protein